MPPKKGKKEEVVEEPEAPLSSDESEPEIPQEDTGPEEPVMEWTVEATPGPDCPSTRVGASFVNDPTIGEKGTVIMFGGYDGRTTHNDVWFLDIESNIWARMDIPNKVVPKARNLHCACVSNGLMYVMGGDDQNGNILNDMYTLDLSTLKWKVVQQTGFVPRDRTCGSLVAHPNGRNLFFFGGSTDGKKAFNDVYRFNLATHSWTPETGVRGLPPCGRYNHSVAVFSNYMLVFGGFDGHRCLNDLHLFNMSKNKFEWSEMNVTGSIPNPRQNSSMIVVEDWLALFGGADDAWTCFNDLHSLDLQTGEWRLEAVSGQLPEPRCNNLIATSACLIPPPPEPEKPEGEEEEEAAPPAEEEDATQAEPPAPREPTPGNMLHVSLGTNEFKSYFSAVNMYSCVWLRKRPEPEPEPVEAAPAEEENAGGEEEEPGQ